MQSVDILRIKFLDFQAEANGQIAIAALIVIAVVYLLRRRH